MNETTDTDRTKDFVEPDPVKPVGTSHDHPRTIGRYRVRRLLGQGGYGRVYLAHDDDLKRPVAIKVPNPERISSPEDIEAYLDEARILARLDHAHIVPVYDVGRTDDGLCYVVSKYVEGSDLAAKIQESRPGPHESAGLVATVADALHYAHSRGLVHRDIKPANILIDAAGEPCVADFGLALRDEDFGKGAGYAGTPAYMSPEQARGEGHRVDGRSDIFSLGVVLYELLTGRRPFAGGSRRELLDLIASTDARPPRQIDDTIPKALERICLKAMSRRASERYTSAGDMADDLGHCLHTLGSPRDPPEISPELVDVAGTGPPATPDLGRDAFVSYATPDKETAYRFCRLLEEQGIGCWIAPRDVPPGADYGEAIIRAIEATKATLLLLSAHANASIHVTHEVERATSKRKRVIPLRLEDVQPSPSLELHLATAQWVDAWRISSAQVVAQLVSVVRGEGGKPTTPSRPDETPPTLSSSDQHPLKIVPKGLRSFDGHDADFFLELLPGPRDRDGLPDSIRFWKRAIEPIDPDLTFKVGLIYGPSGCGKSSLVKAGLLPRLAKNVLPVYIEATPEETEARLLRALRKACPDLSPRMGLVDSLMAIRHGRVLRPGQKALLVLDQFEQWLHARRGAEDTELVHALRQCDGEHVQAVVMVRDDFWLAVTRFMDELEIELLKGQNTTLVDLFDARHARRVLTAFGTAYGNVPERTGDISRDQDAFLDRAITELAQDGKVISVRLALFAEMVKGKPWTPATLRDVGGTEGVGVTFLEETFSSPQANPKHRLHQKAAQAVLKALLPETGTEIRGQMRSEGELQAAAAYAELPREFTDLIRILDGELRLITPTDPEGSGDERPSAPPGGRYYQLTHDYLVPSLRGWLTRKQRETRRGRAELRLSERSALWNAKPENRFLPSAWDWCRIRLLTRKNDWNEPQRRMMKRARRVHGLRTLGMAFMIALLTWGGVEVNGRLQAVILRDKLLGSPLADVPGIIAELGPYRRWVDPLLRRANAEAQSAGNFQKQLRSRLALLPVDGTQLPFLEESLLRAEAQDTSDLRRALESHKDALAADCWRVLEHPTREDRGKALPAASALALYDPRNPRWSDIRAEVANRLVAENSYVFPRWVDALLPVANRLRDPLIAIFRDKQRAEAERTLAANALAMYVQDQPIILSGLLVNATESQFAALYPQIAGHADQTASLLENELDKVPPSIKGRIPTDEDNKAWDEFYRRQANAAVALIRMERGGQSWQPLKNSSNPSLRTYLIHRFAILGYEPGSLDARLDRENEVSIRRALILSLGEYGGGRLSTAERDACTKKLLDLYLHDPDPGIHGAADWLLRLWGHEAELKEFDEKLARLSLPALRESQAEMPPQAGERRWYVNRQDQTMTIVPGPVEVEMGEEFERHRIPIGHGFAIAAKEVTVEQFQRFLGEKPRVDARNDIQSSPVPTCPMNSVSWFDSAAYCNWLSEQEGIPEDRWCYAPNEQGVYAEGMKLKSGYERLNGYRLPTEAEWEFSCRAGATTGFSFGDPWVFLAKYGWYTANSDGRTYPVGRLKPNDLGLFDMHGNLWEWCQDRYNLKSNDKESNNIAIVLSIGSDAPRVLRGGSFLYQAAIVRSAYRERDVPSLRLVVSGFRPARTYP